MLWWFMFLKMCAGSASGIQSASYQPIIEGIRKVCNLDDAGYKCIK